jgi:hypothetical protein
LIRFSRKGPDAERGHVALFCQYQAPRRQSGPATLRRKTKTGTVAVLPQGGDMPSTTSGWSLEPAGRMQQAILMTVKQAGALGNSPTL